MSQVVVQRERRIIGPTDPSAEHAVHDNSLAEPRNMLRSAFECFDDSVPVRLLIEQSDRQHG